MHSRTRQSVSQLSPTQGSSSRTPRTIPVTYPDSMAFRSAPMDDLINPNFCLTSINGSRRYPGSSTGSLSTGYYPDSDDFMMSASSAMNYPSLTAPDNSFALAVTSTHGGFDTDPVYEFLTDDVLSENSFTEMNLVSSHYPGQIQTQDMMNSGYMPADLSPYDSGMMNNAYSMDIPLANPPLTPPPEEQVHQELFQQRCLSGQNFLDDSYHVDHDMSYYEANAMSKTYSYRSDRLISCALRLLTRIRAALHDVM